MHEACTCKRAPPERTRACTSACARACTHRECVCLPVGLHTRCVQGEHACARMRTHQEHPCAKHEACTRVCTQCIHCTLCSPPFCFSSSPPPQMPLLCPWRPSVLRSRRALHTHVQSGATCAMQRAACKARQCARCAGSAMHDANAPCKARQCARCTRSAMHGAVCTRSAKRSTVQCARGVQCMMQMQRAKQGSVQGVQGVQCMMQRAQGM